MASDLCNFTFPSLPVTQRLYSKVKKQVMRLETETHHLEFLRTCKDLAIIPKFLKASSKFLEANYRKAKFDFEFLCLKGHIRRKYALVEQITTEIYGVRNDGLYHRFASSCTAYEFDIAMRKIEAFRNGLSNELKRKLEKKINALSNGFATFKNKNKPQCFINLSNRQFTEEEKELLNRGPKFISRTNTKPIDLIPQFESIIQHIPNNAKEEVRSYIFQEYKKCLNKNTQTHDTRLMKKMKEYGDVVYIPTDKSNKIAILDKSTYIKKMTDTITSMGCTPVTSCPLTQYMNKVNKLKDAPWPDTVRTMKKANPLGVIPHMFGTLKDHKTNLPLRPIVSRCTAPSYYLEKVLVVVLKEILPHSERTIVSTKQFIERLEQLNLPQSFMMATLDIVSLYPSVNMNHARDKIAAILSSNNIYSDDINRTIISAINLIINHNYFKFNGVTYKQELGTPMGSPISGFMAEFILRELEENFITQTQIKPTVWWRFVDDVFVIWPSTSSSFIQFCTNLNQQNPSIQFTWEMEKDHTIPYLDVLLTRTNGQISRTVYRKPMNNQHTITKEANAPKIYKQAAYRTYIRRAMQICTPNNIHQELNKIRSIAVSNGFNLGFINDLILQVTRKITNLPNQSQAINQQPREPIKRVPLEYIPGMHEKLNHYLAPHNIRLIARTQKKLTDFLKTNLDPIETENKAGVYEVPVTLPDGTVKPYIGLTSRKLKIRLEEHKRNVKNHNLCSALTRTFYNNPGSTIDFQNAKIISPFTTRNKATLRESLEIHKRKKNVCNDQDSLTIPGIWKTII